MQSRRKSLRTLALAAALATHQFSDAADITFSPGIGVTETYTTNFSALGSPVNFIKNGAGTVVMEPASEGVVTGSTTVNEGLFRLNKSSGLGNRTLPNGTIEIKSGTTLQIDQANQIGDATTTTIDAGTMTFNSSEYLATITMKNNATINGTSTFVMNGTQTAGLVATGGGNAGSVSANIAMASSWADGTTASNPRTGNGTTPITVDANTFLTISGNLVPGLESTPIGSMQKNGAGQLILNGNGQYLGTTTVAGGTLTLNGRLEKYYWNGSQMAYEPAETTTVNAGARINGTGVTTGALAGAGSVEPGNSAGILTAAALNPSAGLDFAFEFGATDPNYGSASTSLNDLLRLTSLSPFAAALNSSNAVSIYLDFATITNGDVLTGGFFTDQASDFYTSIANADFEFFILGDGNGSTRTYNGVGYYSLSQLLGLTMDISTTAVTAAFAGGSVNGQVMTLSVVPVPEPSTYAMAIVASAVLAAGARRRHIKAKA
jgi:autotransporter-associated beta strand protein